MDELSRIEANYGCVAEYNRVMNEERTYRYAPSAKELFEREKGFYLYDIKKKMLNGSASELAKSMRSQYERNKLDFAKNYYAAQEQYKEYTLTSIETICALNGLAAQDEGFYRPEKGTLAIEVEYIEFSEIKTRVMTNLGYDIFKSLFCDLKECGFSPSVSFWFGANLQTRSHCTLGELRLSDFVYAGFESEEKLNNALAKAGYDEEALIAEFAARNPLSDFEEWAEQLAEDVERHNRYVDRFFHP
jgi:hypothetical protein